MAPPNGAGGDAYAEWVAQRGGSRVIRKILIANNGLGAAKCIRSMRRWAYQTFRQEGVLHFVAMATPDDVAANAEYVRLADEFVQVPGGSNRNNYANVELVVKVARRCEADAVWPGWGHASENPKLPATLALHDIVFIGPSASAMDAVGDKICANLLAQSVGVNVIPWSGSGLTVPGIIIPDDILQAATLHSVEEALACVKRVGYPCMIKASEGGGGKGIRKVNSDAEMVAGFEQVQAEVVGSPVFIQKLSTESRHLEVQMIADGQGAAVALYGRDCSVQRRHQKILEEGPYGVAPPALQRELERGAVRLALKVGYQGAGTVEYLYNMRTGEYSFLEVNPRLQVEHPVTETITGVNIPATQLQIACGIPLHRIADIRAFFNADPAGTERIDFDATPPRAPLGHCMAARITAENPEEGFKPTSGAIHELGFRGVPGVTAFFSVGPVNSGVHQFADSQFGHVFALAPTRDAAIALLVTALADLSIRGEIHTNTKYLMSLLERPAFREDTHDTAWLDGLIAVHDRAPRCADHVAVICGAVVVAEEQHSALAAAALASLERGVAPEAHAVNLSEHAFDLVYNGQKYVLRVTLGGPLLFYVWLNGARVEAEAMKLPDGGLKVLLGGRTHLVYRQPSKTGLLAHVDGWPCAFPADVDPTRMVAPAPAKLLRYLVPSGGLVAEGQPYAEVESMKMVMPLLATSTGAITHTRVPGAALDAGDVLCSVLLTDPASVKPVSIFSGQFPALAPRTLTAGSPEGSFYLRYHVASAGVRRLLAGYDCGGEPLTDLLAVLASPQLVADDLDEQRAAVSARAPAPALAELAAVGAELRAVCATWNGPARSLAHLDDVAVAVQRVAEWLSRHALEAALPELAAFCDRYGTGLYAHECAVLTALLTQYLDVEQPFAAAETFADAVLALAAAHKGDLAAVVTLAHSHAKLGVKNALMLRVLEAVDATNATDAEECVAAVARFGALQRAPAYAAVAQRAKAIVLRRAEESRDTARRWKTAQTSLVKSMPYIKEMGASYSGAAAAAAQSEAMRHSVSGYLPGAEATPHVPRAPAPSRFGAEAPAALRRGSDSALPPGAPATPLTPGGEEASFTALFDFGAPDGQLTALRSACAALGAPTAAVALAGATARATLPGLTLYVAPSLAAVPALLAAHDADAAPAAAFLLATPPGASLAPDAAAATAGEALRGASLPDGLEAAWVVFLSPGVPPASLCFARPPGAGAATPLAESALLRGCLPSLAAQLELERLAGWEASCVAQLEPRRAGRAPSRAALAPAEYRIGVYLAEERGLAGKSARDRRVFVRAAVYNKALLLPPRDGAASPAGAMYGPAGGLRLGGLAAAAAFGQPRRRRRLGEENILADLLGSLELAVGQHHTAWNALFVAAVGAGAEDAEAAEEVVQAFTEQFGADLHRLKVVSLELKVGPGRVVATQNGPGTAYEVGYVADTGAPRPYPPLSKLQRKRMVAQSLNTTYCYDFPELFAASAAAAMAAAGLAAPGDGPVFSATELALVPGSRTVLQAVDRTAGGNDCAIVAWRCRYASPALPAGRDFILVANDITHASGSFSPAEDDVYCAATRVGQAEGLPCVYVSANSGARIGLDDAVKAAFKAAWVDPADPALGFKYLYLDEADYKFLKEAGSSVICEALPTPGGTHYALRDVPGGLGQECLQGSGAIASITSAAYASTMTVTYVTARSVGIGAYVSRLSRRVIQHAEAPLILTGASALNKLLGRDVYTSNNQIGGPKVMATNGVSHAVVPDDAAGVDAILRWLAYVPARRGAPLPVWPTADPITRPPAFTPPPGLPYDPRELLAGFFDAGSWTECMAEWGRSVVAGRATLGGLPCGVVAVETRTVEKTTPADPAFAAAQQTVEQQAGQVWFPDSAHKTAQAIRDFDGEGIPLMIFANWRGFAGGLRDMFGEILKFGAMIVDALREFRQPVMVYIPPGGELRGGAWVVIDATINPAQMQFFAADTARGGVLEPEGIVDIKFRKEDLVRAMRRTLPQLAGLPAAEAAATEKDLLPLFKQVAVQYAALHDTPGVMAAKSVIDAVVPWAEARAYFATQLRRRLAQERIKAAARAAVPGLAEAGADAAVEALRAEVEAAAAGTGPIVMDSPVVAAHVKGLRGAWVKAQMATLAEEAKALGL